MPGHEGNHKCAHLHQVFQLWNNLLLILILKVTLWLIDFSSIDTTFHSVCKADQTRENEVKVTAMSLDSQCRSKRNIALRPVRNVFHEMYSNQCYTFSSRKNKEKLIVQNSQGSSPTKHSGNTWIDLLVFPCTYLLMYSFSCIEE